MGTSSTRLKTLLSAPTQALVAREVTLPGTGSRVPVLSLAVTTPTLAVATPAILTAWLLVLIMFQRLQSTQPAHLLSTHLLPAPGAAAKMVTASRTPPTRCVPPRPTASVAS